MVQTSSSFVSRNVAVNKPIFMRGPPSAQLESVQQLAELCLLPAQQLERRREPAVRLHVLGNRVAHVLDPVRFVDLPETLPEPRPDGGDGRGPQGGGVLV